MEKIVGILGALQIFGGALFYAEAVSAIHQILGAVTFGLGVVSVALAAVIGLLKDILAAAPPP